MENKTILRLSLIFGNHKNLRYLDLRGVLNFRHLYYTEDSIAVTFQNGTEITMFPMRDLDEWYIDQLISTRRTYMLSRRSRFIKQRGLELLPNVSNIVPWPLDLAASKNLLLRLNIYVRLVEMSWSMYHSFRSRIGKIVISVPLWKVMAMLSWM